MTYRLLALAERLVGDRTSPIQVFATFCEDTGNNAVYLHSPNPNGTPFPHTFEGVKWGVAAPIELSGSFDAATHEVGWLASEEFGNQHVLRALHGRASS